jgi:hypothetical protein
MQLEPLRVSEDVRSALLASAIPNDARRALPGVADWGALLQAAQVHGLVPLVSERLRDSDCPGEVKWTFLTHRLAHASRLAQLEKHLADVVSRFDAARVPTLVLKGPALANSIYPKPSMRPYGDIDIVCREQDWVAAHDLLVSAGYIPVSDLTAPPPKVWGRKAYYHTQYYRPNEAILVEVHYDLWQIGLRPKLGDEFWRRAVPVTISGTEARMLAPEDQVLHLCVHLHHHGYKRLIWFTDLALLLRGCPDLDWEYVVRAAREEGVGPSIYYGLTYLERLLGVAAPAWVLRALHPAPLQRAFHDHLWPAQAILDLEIDNTVSCGEFHEVPEATELVSNMILSGRRWEKLLYLLRLLVPSSAWLAYYYQTADPATLRKRRLVHAPKLLAIALGELGSAVVRAARGERWVPPHELSLDTQSG